ncbi:MAG: hypothetical protein Q7R45_11175 [Sulfuricaulis sp.]|nr:hypothetical protein [Sulfuricaulis sp.]
MNTRIRSRAFAVAVIPASIKYLLSEILQVKGLMPLLMKPCNKQRWTSEERAELVVLLRRLSNISPYLFVLALPGSFLMLPVLGWWFDWRRNRRRPK